MPGVRIKIWTCVALAVFAMKEFSDLGVGFKIAALDLELRGAGNLLAYSALKTTAEQIGIEAVDRRHNVLNVKFHKGTRVDPARLMNIVGKTKGAQFTPAGVLLLPLDGQAAGEILRFLAEKLEQLRVT